MFIRRLFKNEPVAGKDAQWIGYCSRCDDHELQVSRNGFLNGGITHCYECGSEKETSGFNHEALERMKLSCRSHWCKYPMLPYNWHELSEFQRWNILGMNAS